MTYQEFKKEYTEIFNRMMGYSPDQAGANIFADKMAELADQYPDFEERLEEELMP